MPDDKLADSRNAMRTTGTVVYSRIEWPDKAAHVATGQMDHLAKAGSRFSPE